MPLRSPLLRAACVLALAATAAAGYAADTAPPPPPGMPGMMMQGDRMALRDPQARAQKRLDKLQKELHLQATQQAAWADYRNTVTAMAAQHAAQMQGKMAQRDAAQPPLPQRLREHAAMMRAHADQLDKLAQATQTLYQTLSPEQQTIFELASRPRMPHHMMMMGGMMDGMMDGMMGGMMSGGMGH